ncbi:uncharacterized protein BDW47DRAFT_75598 [Aspergillus candidus]|uniref:Uncharacterized protein n=1 Tax=Aspergillus candidus TaxID=41067 RepID=A0A2I2FKJ3_ASPCN|nr:hypothetical protein BDW47DRAFT_75598 [Aspergillus candidus]PLB41140.1 hypothetical protein BDW47DRAFT_75598 [Aspergillus candidus]
MVYPKPAQGTSHLTCVQQGFWFHLDLFFFSFYIFLFSTCSLNHTPSFSARAFFLSWKAFIFFIRFFLCLATCVSPCRPATSLGPTRYHARCSVESLIHSCLILVVHFYHSIALTFPVLVCPLGVLQLDNVCT